MLRRASNNRGKFESFREARTDGDLSRKEARKLFPREGLGKILGLYDFVVDTQIDAFDAVGKAVGIGKVGTGIFEVEKTIANAPVTILDKSADLVLDNEQKLRAIRVLADVAGIGLVAAGTIAAATGVGAAASPGLIAAGGTVLTAGQYTTTAINTAQQIKQAELAFDILANKEDVGKIGISKFSVYRTSALKEVEKQNKVNELISTVNKRAGVTIEQSEARELIFGSDSLSVEEQKLALKELEEFVSIIENANRTDTPLTPDQAKQVLAQRKNALERQKEKELDMELEEIRKQLEQSEDEDGIIITPEDGDTIEIENEDEKDDMSSDGSSDESGDGPPIVSNISKKTVDNKIKEDIITESQLAEISEQGLENTSQREDARPSAKAPIVSTVGLDISETDPLEDRLFNITPLTNDEMLSVIGRDKLKQFGKSKGIKGLTNKPNKQSIIDSIMDEQGEALEESESLFNEIVEGLISADNKKQWLKSNGKLINSLRTIDSEAAEEIRDVAKDLIKRDN